jgi:hypothetical protein
MLHRPRDSRLADEDWMLAFAGAAVALVEVAEVTEDTDTASSTAIRW